MNLKAFEDYLSALAISHVDLGNGNPDSKCFVRIVSDDELNKLISAPAANPRVVILENVTAQQVGDLEESKFRHAYTLSFLGYVNTGTGDTTTVRDTEIDTMWRIMMDFRAKLLHDLEADDCGPLKGLSYRMEYKFIQTMELVSHYGWELLIYQTVQAPEYDAERWV